MLSFRLIPGIYNLFYDEQRSTRIQMTPICLNFPFFNYSLQLKINQFPLFSFLLVFCYLLIIVEWFMNLNGKFEGLKVFILSIWLLVFWLSWPIIKLHILNWCRAFLNQIWRCFNCETEISVRLKFLKTSFGQFDFGILIELTNNWITYTHLVPGFLESKLRIL